MSNYPELLFEWPDCRVIRTAQDCMVFEWRQKNAMGEETWASPAIWMPKPHELRVIDALIFKAHAALPVERAVA